MEALEGPVVVVECASAAPAFVQLRSGRIRYTVVAASPRYVAFAANTGSVYVYDRGDASGTLKYLQTFAAADCEIAAMTFAPLNDNLLAVGTIKGGVAVWELNINAGKDRKGRTVFRGSDHKAPITALQWHPSGERLWSGDDAGVVHTASVGERLMNLLKKAAEPLFKTDSRVVQLDYNDEKLVISSLTRVVIFNLRTQASVAVGKKARQGHFGACFMRSTVASIYSARPGLRLWSCDLTGSVLATLNFQESLQEKSAPTVILDALVEAQRAQWQDAFDEQPQQSAPPAGQPNVANINFTKLVGMSGRYLVSWHDNAFFLIDATEVEIPIWVDGLTDIRSVGVSGSDVFILYDGARRLICLSLMSPHHAVGVLTERGNLSAAVDLAIKNAALLLANTTVLHALGAALPAEEDDPLRSSFVAAFGENGFPPPPPPPVTREPTPPPPTPPLPPVVAEPEPVVESKPAASEPMAVPRSLPVPINTRAFSEGTSSLSSPDVATPASLPSESSFMPGSVDESALVAQAVDYEPVVVSRAAPRGPMKRKTTKRLIDIDDPTRTTVLTVSAPPSGDAPIKVPQPRPIRKSSSVILKESKSEPTPPSKLSPRESPAELPVRPKEAKAEKAEVKSEISAEIKANVKQEETVKAEVAVETKGDVPSEVPTEVNEEVITEVAADVKADVEPAKEEAPPADVAPDVPLTASQAETEIVVEVAKSDAAVVGAEEPAAVVIEVEPTLEPKAEVVIEPTLAKAVTPEAKPMTPEPKPELKPEPKPGVLRTLGIDESETRQILRGIAAEEAGRIATATSAEIATTLARFTELTDGILVRLAAERRALNGLHPMTHQALIGWLSFFAGSMWRHGDAIMAELERRKPAVRSLLTLCLRLGVTSARSRVGAQPDDAEAIAFVREYAKFLDMAAVTDYFVQRRFCDDAIVALCAIDEGLSSSDEARLLLKSHLEEQVEGTPAAAAGAQRAFELLSTAPSNQIILILTHLRALCRAPNALTAAPELFVSVYPRILPVHIKSVAPADIYLAYLNRLLGASGPAAARADAEAATECLRVNLALGPPASHKSPLWESDADGVRRPARNATGAAWGATGRWLRVVVDKAAVREKEATTMCIESAYWDGAMALLERGGRVGEATEMALWADDKKWWVRLAPQCAGKDTWTSLLKQFEAIRRARAGQPNAINAVDVMERAMVQLGAAVAIEVILQYPSICEGLPPAFYERFLQLAAADQRRANCVHSMLESLDSYLLVRRTNVTAPQFRYLRTLEMVHGKERMAKEPFVQEKTVGTGVFLDVSFDSLPALPHAYEDAEAQWGAALVAAPPACAVCGLQVHDSVGAPTTAVMFECGHAFHQLCVPEETCSTCFSESFKSVQDVRFTAS